MQAAAKELRSAQRRASECRARVRGEAPATAAAAAAAAQALRADDCRQGTAPSVSPRVRPLSRSKHRSTKSAASNPEQ